MTRAAEALLVVAIAWGTFAFGAPYPWAYWPMAGAAALAAVLALLTPAPPPVSSGTRRLAWSFAVFIAVAALQLIPLAPATLARLSPATPVILRQFDPLFASGLRPNHPLSIDPAATRTAMALFAAFALTIVGSARLFSVRGARAMARAVTVIGVGVALSGIVFRPMARGKVYGFWTPMEGGAPFGPFVNKNHFAGWMLLALPLTLGLMCGSLARGMRGAKPGLRDRVLWLGSDQASHLLIYAGAATLMALSLVLTISRSGIAAMIVALAITATLVLRARQSRSQRIVALAFLASLLIGVLWASGLATIVSHFEEVNLLAMNDRRGIWADTAAIVSQFPWTGTGLNTFASAILFYQAHDLGQQYTQAHNDYLQLVSEGGVMLAVPAVACAALFVQSVRRRFTEDVSVSGYWLRAGAVTGLCALALQECVDFSLQMPGNALLFSVLCGIALHRTPERRRA